MTERTGLGIEREVLVDVAAALATRRPAALDRALVLAARFGSQTSVDEVLLQSHLFVGFPLVLEAFLLWRQILPSPGLTGAEPDEPEGWRRRGEQVCRTVYGSSYEKLRANVAHLHAELDAWMVTGGYGRAIGRPGLDLVTRELCIAALLAVWGTPRQLHSHLRGALNAGAHPVEVRAAIDIACRHLDPGAVSDVLELREKVLGTPARGLSGRS